MLSAIAWPDSLSTFGVEESWREERVLYGYPLTIRPRSICERPACEPYVHAPFRGEIAVANVEFPTLAERGRAGLLCRWRNEPRDIRVISEIDAIAVIVYRRDLAVLLVIAERLRVRVVKVIYSLSVAGETVPN